MKKGLSLITSGAYVNQELAVEFGNLPPAFLPVAVKRLYELQIETLGREDSIYLSVPETYEIPEHDRERLKELEVQILMVPEGLSLGDSVVYALNLIGGPDQRVRILHGDTLVVPISYNAEDELALAYGRDGYSWAEAILDNRQIKSLRTITAGISSDRTLPIVCGYFSFSRSTALIRGITRARGSFIDGIMLYANEIPIYGNEVTGWFDFGHVQTFFRSRRLVTSARAFNSLHIDGQTARKSSSDREKILSESHWFASVPPRVRLYCARLIDAGETDGIPFYETEYEHLPTLAELFVFCTLARPAWTTILNSCCEFLATCSSSVTEGCGGSVLRSLVLEKTRQRLVRFADETGFDVTAMLRYAGRPMPSLAQIADDLGAYLNLSSMQPRTVMHGDFCFSNILYDSRVQRIHVIDPRGYVDAGSNSIYGDTRYDLAKLSHSIIGRYDHIVAGRYKLTIDRDRDFEISFDTSAPHYNWLEAYLKNAYVNGIAASGTEVQAISISLFLSMLPLHSDRPDRQRAFIANALRLYAGLNVKERPTN